MNNKFRILLAVLLPLLFFSLILFSLPLGKASAVEAAGPAQVRPLPTPAAILVDELDDLSKVYTRSADLTLDNSFPARFDGDASRAIPTSGTTAQGLVWAVEADGVKEFEAVSYHLVDRPVTHLKFYISTSGNSGSFTAITPTIQFITPTNTGPNTTDWTRVRYEFAPASGMDYVKVEFPVLPIDRNPRQLGVISFGAPIPLITAVTPEVGPNDVPVTMDIYGDNFEPGITGYLVSVTETWRAVSLDNLLYVSPSQLRATLPVTLTLGGYHMKVVNPSGSRTYQVNAYNVLDGALFDDLYADEFDLIIEPVLFYQGDSITPTLKLALRRWGGKTDLAGVEVAFYDGHPSLGGILGTATANSVAPYSQTLTSEVNWTLFDGGSYDIYAKIDPNNLVAEANEDNNLISRTVLIHHLPVELDALPPQVDSFMINDGAQSTGDRTVMLKTLASDTPTGNSVASVFYLEYEFVQSAGDWLPVAFSDADNDGAPDWLPYDSAAALEGAPWTLTPAPGLHYLKVWVADAYGNVSETPGAATINLLPASADPATILQDEIHLYRLDMAAGQSTTVLLTSVAGDADLYVWKPDGTAQSIQETGTPVEQVSFTASMSGTYQIEVAGFTNATYTLELVNPAKATSRSPMGTARRPRSDPLADPGDTPSENVGLPQAPVTIQQLYLPVTRR